jgi:hypothetical protein
VGLGDALGVGVAVGAVDGVGDEIAVGACPPQASSNVDTKRRNAVLFKCVTSGCNALPGRSGTDRAPANRKQLSYAVDRDARAKEDRLRAQCCPDDRERQISGGHDDLTNGLLGRLWISR